MKENKLSFILIGGLLAIVGCSDNKQTLEERSRIINENEKNALESKHKEAKEKELQLWKEQTFKTQEKGVSEAKEQLVKENKEKEIRDNSNKNNSAVKRVPVVSNYKPPQTQKEDNKFSLEISNVRGRVGRTVIGTKTITETINPHKGEVNTIDSYRRKGKEAERKVVTRKIPDYGYEIKFTISNISKVSKNVMARAGKNVNTLTVPPLTVTVGELRTLVAPTSLTLTVDGISQNFAISY